MRKVWETGVFTKRKDFNIKVGVLKGMFGCIGLGGVKEGFGSVRNWFE